METKLTRLLETFAYHVSCLHCDHVNLKAGETHKGSMGIEAEDGTSVVVKYSVSKSPWSDDPVWDQFYMNGFPVGNRCGAHQELARLYAPVIEAQAAHDAKITKLGELV